MTDTSRTPDEIEREIERERLELAATVGAIQDRFSPEAIIRTVADGFRDHGSDIGVAVSRSVKQNPVALTLTGIGLAWMIFGRSHSETREVSTPSGGLNRSPGSADYRDELDEDRDRTRPRPHRSSYSSSHHESADRGRHPHWSRVDLDDNWDDADTGWSSYDDQDDALSSESEGLSERAAASIRGVAETAGSVVRGGASRAGAAGNRASESVGDVGRRSRAHIARIRARLSRDTEDMTEAARERVIMARASAIDMAQKADRAMRDGYVRGRDTTQEFIEDQPLVAGALAVAIGAALAGALPRTRREDELLGARRDDLFDEADRIFREEKQKAERVARAAMSEVADIAEETREDLDGLAPKSRSAVEGLADEMKTAGERVANATTESAKEQKLGKPRS